MGDNALFYNLITYAHRQIFDLFNTLHCSILKSYYFTGLCASIKV